MLNHAFHHVLQLEDTKAQLADVNTSISRQSCHTVARDGRMIGLVPIKKVIMLLFLGTHDTVQQKSKLTMLCSMPGRERQVLVLVGVVDCSLDMDDDGVVACSCVSRRL